MKKIIIVTVLFALLGSCTSIDKEVEGLWSARNNRISRFHAAIEQGDAETKVFADNKMRVLWNAGDLLTVFNQSTYNSKFEFAGEDGDNAGDFDDVTPSGLHSGNALSNIYAVYPYVKGNKINNDGNTITLTLPAEQQYKEHSFGIGANAMVAVTDNDFLAFKNLGGYLQLRLYGDNVKVSRIKIQGNNGEKIAGKANVAVGLGALPTVTMDETATDAITLVCDPPVEIGTTAEQYTDFWFVIPPTTFSGGFTIAVTDELGGVFEKTTTNNLTIARSIMEWMSALHVIPNYDNVNVVFKDANFKAYCVENFDTNEDRDISLDEARAVTRIDVCTDNIVSMGGIEYFTNLNVLICRASSLVLNTVNHHPRTGILSDLDVSHNDKLTYLDCSGNLLEQLDLSNNTRLRQLRCSINNLTYIDVSNNLLLLSIDIDGNQLETIDILHNENLNRLGCSLNNLTYLDVSNNVKLTELACGENFITSLSVLQNPELRIIGCGGNQISSLDLSNNQKLELLQCHGNKLNKLDLSHNFVLSSVECETNDINELILTPSLKLLWCDNNQLTSVDVSNCTELTSLDCYDNQLTYLDVSNCTVLNSLACGGNQLTSLDVSNCTVLTYLGCSDNQLTNLDVSNNTLLSTLYCENNPYLTEIWLNQGQEIDYLEYDSHIATIKYKNDHYSFRKAYALPGGAAGDLIDLYANQVVNSCPSTHLMFKSNEGKIDSLIIEIDAADKETFDSIADSVWTGLQSTYEDFGRSYLFDLNGNDIISDRAILTNYANKVQAEHDSILSILRSANSGQADILVNAWSEKVDNDRKGIANLAAKVDEYTNYNHNPNYNIYKYDDRVLSTNGMGPRVIFHYDTTPRRISVDASDETHIILDAVDSPWFDVAPNNALSIAPTLADSLLIINTIKDYFRAIASINEKGIPYLKFMYTRDGGKTFGIDSIRADKVEFAGFKMRKTNAYLDGVIGLHWAAVYDNKGFNDPNVYPTNAANYVDPLTNLIELFNHFVHGTNLTLPLYTARDDAFTYANSGVPDYFQYVTDFKANNTAKNLDGYKKVFDSYTDKQFRKYLVMSYEGKALYAWMATCEKYFGVDGFAGFGEKVFFDYDTFTNPTNIVEFDGIPAYTLNAKGAVSAINRVDVVKPWNSQFAFVANAIKSNLTANDGSTYTAEAYVNTANDMVMKSLVFELLEANHLADFANNSKSMWEELGDVLNQVKTDLDAATAE